MEVMFSLCQLYGHPPSYYFDQAKTDELFRYNIDMAFALKCSMKKEEAEIQKGTDKLLSLAGPVKVVNKTEKEFWDSI